MEYASGGTLSNAINQARAGRSRSAAHGLPELQVRQLLAQIVSGLHACHSYVDPTTGRKRPIIHSDLKPDNILLMGPKDKPTCAKLADFGLAIQLRDEERYYRSGAGTWYYDAPEKSDKYKQWTSIYSDMYALGCILYEMCTTSRYIDLNNPEVSEGVRHEALKAQKAQDWNRFASVIQYLINTKADAGGPKIPSSYSPWLTNLIKRLLSRNMKNRPTTDEILADPVVEAELALMQMAEETPAVQAQLESATQTLNEAHGVVSPQVATAQAVANQVQAYVEDQQRIDVGAQERWNDLQRTEQVFEAQKAELIEKLHVKRAYDLWEHHLKLDFQVHEEDKAVVTEWKALVGEFALKFIKKHSRILMLEDRLAKMEQEEKRALERDQAKRRKRYLDRRGVPRGTRSGDRARDGRARAGVERS